jgi:endonuclease-3
MSAAPPETATMANAIAVIDRLRAVYGEPARSQPQPPIDELVQTILSQHTSDVNTERAYTTLRERFPSWDAVLAAPTAEVADAIRVGGLARQKAPRIQHVLATIRESRGDFDLGFLAAMPLDDALEWLTALNGVGPKTAACVLMFSLDRPVLPVDTHVHRVATRLGFVPPRTTAERTQEVLSALIPPAETFAAHMLLIHHGRQTCTALRPRCPPCPLLDRCPTGQTMTMTRLD